MNTSKNITKEKCVSKIVHFRPIFFAFVFLLVGIIFARKIYSGNLTYILLSCGILLTVLTVAIYQDKILPFFICLLCFLAGNGAFFFATLPVTNARVYENAVVVCGRVTDQRVDLDYGCKSIILENVSIDGESSKNVYLIISNCGELNTGDSISVETNLEKISLFDEDKFNNRYLRNKVLYSGSVDYSLITRVAGGEHLDEAIRRSIKDALLSTMSEKNANIAYGVLTGEKSGIDDEIFATYRDTGIIHILSVSGLHVGVLAGFVAYLLKLFKVKRVLNFALTFFVLISFCYICSFAPSVVRASIMCLVFLASKLFASQSDSLTNLGFSGILLFCINPLYAFDVGFLMSYGSVLMIFILQKPLENLFSKFLPKWAAVPLSLTISAQIGIMPFMAEFYSTYNFLSPFVNLIAVPYFSVLFVVILLATILTIVFGFLSFLLVPCDFAFSGLNWIAGFYSNSFLSVRLASIDASVYVICFLLLFALGNYCMWKKKPKLIALSIFVPLAIVMTILML